jgi:hypothetical protein
MTHCLVNHHITGHPVFVLVSSERVILCPAMDNPASCKVPVVIRFHRSKNMSVAEIRSELCAVYGQNVMSEGTIRQWYRMFDVGRTNTYTQ